MLDRNAAPEVALLDPVFIPRIWGARSLSPLYSDRTNLFEPTGEAWLTSNDSRFATGRFAGQTLADTWQKLAVDARHPLGVGESAQFPLLAKFIFPAEKLSVQVHPNDEYAAKFEKSAGGRGKTEMWYVADADPGAAVWLGLEEWVTPERFREAIDAGNADQLVERIPIKKGDAIFCPPGTVHYIGPGMTLCEIQQYSDITYRVFDYNRRTPEGNSRQLHLKKAMDVIRFGGQLGGKVDPVEISEADVKKTSLVACPYFIVERFDFDKNWKAPGLADHFNVYIILEGRGQLHHAPSKTQPQAEAPKVHDYQPGQAWLAPPRSPSITFAAQTTTSLLRAFVPHPVNGINEFVRDMRANKIPESQWSRLVFT